jgi:hypothetical protein
MSETLTPFLALTLGGLVFGVAAIITIFLRPGAPGNALLAGALSAGFAAFTAVTIASEGVLPVIANHSSNLWGVQVWWDLLFSLSIGYFFALPRAKAAGMNLPLWTMFVLTTASIGLLAMIARLFWLEQAQGTPARA